MRLNCLLNSRIPPISRSIRMASGSTAKKHIQIDATIDTVCPWCYVGKKNLDKAISSSDEKYTFEVKYHPFLLNPSASKEGVVKKDYFLNKFGPRALQMEARMSEIFKGFGMDYDTSGLTGSTLDSHRLIYFAGKVGADKQYNLVEELCHGYFTQGKFIGDREFLVESAKKVGIDGAAEFLEDPNNGLEEVNDELRKSSETISGVPHYVINGKYELSGGQPPETFLSAFQAAAK
ncbi:uncharacterized protein LOC127240219 isoform X2 [Andrographis paniculata]|uniref:uncharacterized protein LOC127240219 isoform X2 n=1 Tax=Andrographis paniculata TaxID=175694 RepID=UPI0021E77E57|nr:uncharacterized protein LOC127240219 isoform X2 [Andrographis paniculata]